MERRPVRIDVVGREPHSPISAANAVNKIRVIEP